MDVTPEHWEQSVSQGLKQWLSDKPPKPKKDKFGKKKAPANVSIATAGFEGKIGLIDPSLL